MKMVKNKNLRAFSLFEMSIVILIIGILMGGILGGKKLIALSNMAKARALTQSSPVSSVPGLSLWLETTSKSSFSVTQPSDGASIATWKDINPQLFKKDATAVSTGPVYTSNAINGLPALSFSTVATAPMSLGSNYIFSSSKGITIFAVAKPITGACNNTYCFIVDFGFFGNRGYGLYLDQSNIGNYTSSDFGGVNSGVTSHSKGTIPMIISLSIKFNTSQTLYINGVQLYSNAITLPSLTANEVNAASTIGSAGPAGPISICAQSKGLDSSRQFTGYLGEIIIYDTTLTTSQRQEIESYLSKKWGIKI